MTARWSSTSLASSITSDLADRASRLLNRYSLTALRLSMGAVFFGFGALKLVPGLSPAEDVAVLTVERLTVGLVDSAAARLMVALLEVTVGTILLVGRGLHIGLPLLLISMGGILAPLVLFPELMFSGPGMAPSLIGQYVLKDVILLAAVAVLWADFLNRPERTSRRWGRQVRPPRARERADGVDPALYWRTH